MLVSVQLQTITEFEINALWWWPMFALFRLQDIWLFPFNQKFRFENFKNFMNGRVFLGNFPFGCTSPVQLKHSIHSRSEIYNQKRRTGNQNFWNGTQISDQTSQSEKVVHLKRWTFFSKNLLVNLNWSIKFWTKISKTFGRMEGTIGFLDPQIKLQYTSRN